MRTIIITKGIPSSGKTSWTLEEMRKNPMRYKRFNKDSLRRCIDNGVSSPENERFIQETINSGVELALYSGYDVILDNTNFSDKTFYSMCDIAQRVGDVTVVEKYFEVTIKEAIYYNKNRSLEDMVPFHIIENMYEKYVKHKRVETRATYYPPTIQPYEWKRVEHKRSCIIVDLDGTLAVAVSRGYYDLTDVTTDACNIFVKTIIQQFQTCIPEMDMDVVIVTGREDFCKDDTIKWLAKNNIPYDGLYMRKSGDYRSDAIVKEEIYREHIESRWNPFIVFDDRNSIVNLYRKLGLACFQVANGPL